jgi:gluconate 5-dehydrogenase
MKLVNKTIDSAFSLEGEHAIITGGGTGLGFGMAQCFSVAGARVTLVGRREGPLRAACKRLGKGASFLAADITATELAATLIARAEKLNGPLTILVNNAGIQLKKPTQAVTDAEFQAVIQTHVFAAFALAREASHGMLKRRKGNIIFTASMASLIGMPRFVAYSAAKSAYVGMVRSLAAEWASSGVRVNAIAPGWIQSEMLKQSLAGDPVRRARILMRTPMECFGSPEDIGWAAVYLASAAGRFVNGVVLPVDGGASMGF